MCANLCKFKVFKKIVITGGPCAGKTSALEIIRCHFSERGYHVLLVPEMATELILSGVAPWTHPDFQAIRVARQLDAEREVLHKAHALSDDHILIVYDRGVADTRAYTTQEQYLAILRRNGLSSGEIPTRYDAVIHLTSAAKSSVEHYSLQSNAARIETADEAARLDDHTYLAWIDHPHHFIIPALSDFNMKMEQLLDAVEQVIRSE